MDRIFEFQKGGAIDLEKIDYICDTRNSGCFTISINGEEYSVTENFNANDVHFCEYRAVLFNAWKEYKNCVSSKRVMLDRESQQKRITELRDGLYGGTL